MASENAATIGSLLSLNKQSLGRTTAACRVKAEVPLRPRVPHNAVFVEV